jgi:hypothetical protein
MIRAILATRQQNLLRKDALDQQKRFALLSGSPSIQFTSFIGLFLSEQGPLLKLWPSRQLLPRAIEHVVQILIKLFTVKNKAFMRLDTHCQRACIASTCPAFAESAKAYRLPEELNQNHRSEKHMGDDPARGRCRSGDRERLTGSSPAQVLQSARSAGRKCLRHSRRKHEASDALAEPAPDIEILGEIKSEFGCPGDGRLPAYGLPRTAARSRGVCNCAATSYRAHALNRLGSMSDDLRQHRVSTSGGRRRLAN